MGAVSAEGRVSGASRWYQRVPMRFGKRGAAQNVARDVLEGAAASGEAQRTRTWSWWKRPRAAAPLPPETLKEPALPLEEEAVPVISVEERALLAGQVVDARGRERLGMRPPTPQLEERAPRGRRLSVDGPLMTAQYVSPKRRRAIAAFQAEAPRRLERRHSMDVLLPIERPRRPSIADIEVIDSHDRFMEALQRGVILNVDSLKDPRRTLSEALSYALEQYEETLTAEAGWVERLNLLVAEATRQGVDIRFWLSQESLKRQEGRRMSVQDLLVTLIRDPGFVDVGALLGPWSRDSSSERERGFSATCDAIVARLEALRLEFEGVEPNEHALLWIERELTALRTKDPVEILEAVNTLKKSHPIVEHENYARLKEAMLESPEGREMAVYLEESNVLDYHIISVFSSLCRQALPQEKLDVVVRAFCDLKRPRKQDFDNILFAASSNNQWEWMRAVIKTGKASFWDALFTRLRLFFHDLWH